MFRRSSSTFPSCHGRSEVIAKCPSRREGVRSPVVSSGRVAQLGVLALAAAFLADGIHPITGEADDGLLGRHADMIESVAFHPGGRWLAAAGAKGRCHSGSSTTASWPRPWSQPPSSTEQT